MSRSPMQEYRSKAAHFGFWSRLWLATICLLWVVALVPERTPASVLLGDRLSPDSSGQTEPGDVQPTVQAESADGAGIVENTSDARLAAPQRIFSRELLSTTLISLGPSGEPANGSSSAVAIAAGGRYVAFVSKASNLVASDFARAADRGYDQLFVHDRSGQVTEMISVDASGSPGNGWSGAPAITPDGRLVAFYSWASNLVEGDTNGVQDLFVFDRETKEMERLSVGSDGREANGRSGDARTDARPALSADGRYVAFYAAADNLVADDTNQLVDVFVHDRRAHVTVRVSVSSTGQQANADANTPALSVDGRYVAFQSRATNLDRTRLNVGGVSQIFVHDRITGATELVSRSSAGLLADADATHVALSGDGQLVFFQSAATNLVVHGEGGFPNRAEDIYVYDRGTGVTTLVSVASSGIRGNRDSSLPSVSLDGRYVAFLSAASNLTSDDRNDAVDVFVHDRLLRHTTRASVAVTGLWTGEESDGDAIGAPAISLGGNMVAFVSLAANLVAGSVDDRSAGESNAVADVYLHIRQDPPAYAISGVVVDVNTRGIDGAVVVAGSHQARTNFDGSYTIPYVVGGTYTIRVIAPGLEFVPRRQTVSVLHDLTVSPVVGHRVQDAGIAFLDLPFAYDGTVAGFLAALQDTDDGGRVDAWFDHDAPDYAKNGAILLWDGYTRAEGIYNPELGCYARRCYDGHDGIDFPYKDPAPESGNVYAPLVVLAAAAGRVIDWHVDCTDGGPGCNGGYGNEVIVDHGNGFFTRYAHLDAVLARVDSRVSRGDEIGTMGNTGNSNGVHLHFAVHWDNGNGRWDGEKMDGPVDPFGWAGADLDPWSPNQLAIVGHRLWRVGTVTEASLLGGLGATLQDATGRIVAKILAGALDGQAKVELVTGSAVADPEPRGPSRRSLGYAFQLNLLEWLNSATPARASEGLRLSQPIEFSLDLAGIVAEHVDLEQAQLYRWSPDQQRWQALPTLFVPISQADGAIPVGSRGLHLYSATDRLGAFDLQAPLLCGEDVTEPDDAYFAAISLRPGGAPRVGRFDTSEDEDWLRFDGEPGHRYRVTVLASAQDLQVQMQLYEADGLTPVAGLDVESIPGNGAEGVGVSWSPGQAGAYFVRLAPSSASRVGCEADYAVRIGLE